MLGSCGGVTDEEIDCRHFQDRCSFSTDCFTKLYSYSNSVKILISVFESLKLPPKLCHDKCNYY